MKNRYSADIEYLTVGLEHASIEVEAFVNLGCPYSAKFFEIASEVIKPYTDSGHVKFVIKHVDRTKDRLLRGTVANNYVDHDDPIEGFEALKKLFQTQESWVKSFRKTLEMCEDTLGLPEKMAAYERGEAVLEDFNERGLKIVPTVFINGEQLTEYKPADQSKEEISRILTERIESLK
ncbi:thioredoxin domain-containing protein [Jeotgalicoccus halotolerans]|uniref:thioredoxin domain-containing protein n=1 Tax=Jeotgalicoccus halotolerans TaxID=157227 RepID=UPI00351443CB